MSRTTLSDRVSRKIIRCFADNYLIKSAAEECGVSTETTRYYYDLLLIRLLDSCYYHPFQFYMDVWSFVDPKLRGIIRRFVNVAIKNHRGFPNEENMNMYKAKYASTAFYANMYFAEEQKFDEKLKLEDIIFQDIVQIIKRTGPLNVEPGDAEFISAREYIENSLFRRCPRSLRKKYSAYLKTRPINCKNDVTDGEQFVFLHFHKFLYWNKGVELKKDNPDHEIDELDRL